jgi:hypothetical protein
MNQKNKVRFKKWIQFTKNNNVKILFKKMIVSKKITKNYKIS